MMSLLRRRRSDQAGFTLAELLVTTAVIGLIMAGVLVVYQAIQRSTSVGTAAEDAQVVTRVVLEKIVTDLQLINAGRASSAGAILAASATSLQFLGDVDNDTVSGGNNATLASNAASGAKTVQVSSGQGFAVGELLSIQSAATAETQPITAVAGTTLTLGTGLSTPYPAGSIVRSVETVTYTYTAVNGGTLTRTLNGVTDTLATNLPTFQFTYWQGGAPAVQIANPPDQATRDQIKQIGVSLASSAQTGDQSVVRAMTTKVRPRNL